MSAFTQIDLSGLPAPSAMTELSVDNILSDMMARFQTDNPDLGEIVDFESDPIMALNEAWAYREFMFRQYVNSAFKAGLLAFSWGSNLDHLAALVPLTRLDGESDEEFRARIQLAPEGFSVAGPVGAYEFHARAASTEIVDVNINEPSPGTVDVVIAIASGQADIGLLSQVGEALNSDEIRPLTDSVNVKNATLINFDVTAILDISNGPDAASVRATAQSSVEAYIKSRRLIGKSVPRSGLMAALHVDGVNSVDLALPVADIDVGTSEIGELGSLIVSDGPYV